MAKSRMTQWIIAVLERDKKCLRCGSTEDLQAHRVKEHGLVHEVEHIDTSWVWSIDNSYTICADCNDARCRDRAAHHNTTHGD